MTWNPRIKKSRIESPGIVGVSFGLGCHRGLPPNSSASRTTSRLGFLYGFKKEEHTGVSKNRGGPPKWMVKIMENPIKMDDLGGPPLFLGWHPYSPTGHEISLFIYHVWANYELIPKPESFGDFGDTCLTKWHFWEFPTGGNRSLKMLPKSSSKNGCKITNDWWIFNTLISKRLIQLTVSTGNFDLRRCSVAGKT